jgi:hypothetical protein
MYYHHLNLTEYLIVKLIASVFSWEAISAYRISKKQSEILKRQVDLEDYAEIFIRPGKSSITEKWELQIRNASPRVIYVIDAWFEGEINPTAFGNLRFSRREPATLPVGEEYYYISLPIPPIETIEKDDNNVPTFHMHIKFKDILGKEKVSHHAGWFQRDTWIIHNLQSGKKYDRDGSK